jgi:antitoxin ParD1/3/4
MIREKIASGSYNSASEVVPEALRLLEQADEFRVLKLQKLREDIREGLDNGPSTVYPPTVWINFDRTFPPLVWPSTT